MILKYVKSDRGTDIIVHKSYMFYREKQTEIKTYWKYSLYKKYKCGGRVHVENYEVVN